jgi:lipopolysaccharide/colanic/teichoic acid biosynthesis glycosyltransferase
LVHALDNAPRAPTRVAAHLDPASPALVEEIRYAVAQHQAKYIIADWGDPRVAHAFPDMYNFLAVGIRFFDAMQLYEEVFGRIPLSVLDERWFARNVSRHSYTLYDSFKRAMDIAIALPSGILSLAAYPFVIAAIKLDDGGPIFIRQERIGQDGAVIYNYKFRSMQRNDLDLASASHRENKITRVGEVIRKTRLDELPQLWDVVMGRLSLIGPRPELPSGVALYEKEIPYYGVRHLVRPGLSGWAQLYGQHAHHGIGIEETRNKFSYDLYYIKHRSLTLDLVIALKTIKKLLLRSGI